MSHIAPFKKDELVMVIAGDAKGKKARVVKVFPAANRVLLDPVEEGEGNAINPVKKHLRKQASKDQPDGGIVTREASIHASNVMKLDRWLARREKHGKKA